MKPMVTIYSSDTCPYCIATKEYLKSNKIEFIEKNITNSDIARSELMKMGYMSVPLIIIDDEIIEGFDQEKLASILLNI